MALLKLADGSEIEAFTKEELTTEVEKAVTGLKNKTSELLTEKKQTVEELEKLKAAKAAAEEENLTKNKEFEALYSSEKEKHSGAVAELSALREKIKRDKISSDNLKIASTLTKETSRSEMLCRVLSDFAKHTDDGVVYEIGGIEVDQIKLCEHIKGRYPFLVDGSQANGGGAAGSINGGGAAKKPEDMSYSERVELLDNNPDLYKQTFK